MSSTYRELRMKTRQEAMWQSQKQSTALDSARYATMGTGSVLLDLADAGIYVHARLERLTNALPKQEKKEGNTMGEILKDMRGFVRENRSVIYTVALALAVDHFIFKGQFKAKIQEIVEKFLKRAHDTIDNANETKNV